MDFDANWIADRLLILIPLWFSLGVHECAHAWAVRRLGDDTAERLGRLTLNPLAHIDPIGTLLLPLLGVPFGWAKPVPVNPLRFRREVNMRTGMMITAIAGPISNVCLTAISIVALAAVIRFAPQWAVPKHPVVQILVMMMYMNVVLATFNMLPIPPLDGSRIADALIPNAAAPPLGDVLPTRPIFPRGGHRLTEIARDQSLPLAPANRRGGPQADGDAVWRLTAWIYCTRQRGT